MRLGKGKGQSWQSSWPNDRFLMPLFSSVSFPSRATGKDALLGNSRKREAEPSSTFGILGPNDILPRASLGT